MDKTTILTIGETSSITRFGLTQELGPTDPQTHVEIAKAIDALKTLNELGELQA